MFSFFLSPFPESTSQEDEIHNTLIPSLFPDIIRKENWRQWLFGKKTFDLARRNSLSGAKLRKGSVRTPFQPTVEKGRSVRANNKPP